MLGPFRHLRDSVTRLEEAVFGICAEKNYLEDLRKEVTEYRRDVRELRLFSE